MVVKSGKINVAFLMNGAKPPRGGEFYTLYLITHLNRDIFNPILIYSVEGEIVKKIKETGIESVQLSLSEKLASIYLREINLLSPFFLFTFLWSLLKSRCFFKLNRILKKNDIRLIYAADNLSKFIGGVVSKFKRIPIVAHCHDRFTEDLLGKIMRGNYLFFLNKILAVSDDARDFFKSKGKILPDKVLTVHNGVDSHIFDPKNVDLKLRKELGIKEDVIVIGNVGAFDQFKAQIYLLDAVLKLKNRGLTNILCVLCGKGTQRQKLEAFVIENGLTKNVLFLGFRTDIPRVLRMLDIMVLCSLHDAFPISVLEAMSMGIPIVATNVGGVSEAVEDGRTGILVPPQDSEKIAEVVRELIKNSELRKNMGRSGRKRVLEKFTLESNINKVENIFLHLLGKERITTHANIMSESAV